MRKHGLKVLGLAFMAALSLMALTATAAQAVALEWGDKPGSGEAGEFLVEGTNSPTGATTQAVNAKQIGTSTLLIPSKGAEINCGKFTITSAIISNQYNDVLLPGTKLGGHGKGSVLFEECTVLEINAAGELVLKEGKPVELTKCTEELNKGSSPVGQHHVTVNNALLLVRKHEGATYLVIEPEISTKAQDEEVAALTAAFTTLTFGGTCSLPLTPVKITGALAVKVPAADAVKPKIPVDTFSAAGKAEQALLGTKLKFGANEAFIKGEVEAELVGKEVKWGAM